METPSAPAELVRKTFHLPRPLVSQLEHLASAERRSVTAQTTLLLEQALASHQPTVPAPVVITTEAGA